jgi:pyruvate dehydrogenase complex dehydrogenase (E1) component
MDYTTDTHFLLMLFILPSLFGFTLIGDGVNKVMNYDNRGWITVSAGSIFVLIILIAYLMLAMKN